jgi:hypothetical protein
MLEVTVNGWSNITVSLAAEIAATTDTSARHLVDEPCRNRRHQRHFGTGAHADRHEKGRRLLPPQQPGIVPQARRERPPTRPCDRAPRPDRGGRSRLACLPLFSDRTGCRTAPKTRPEWPYLPTGHLFRESVGLSRSFTSIGSLSCL